MLKAYNKTMYFKMKTSRFYKIKLFNKILKY